MSKDVEVTISKRKLYPLLLLTKSQVEGTTRFHKLMYILKKEFDIPVEHQFIKYHYGPFSSDLREDIGFFIENGYISQTSTEIGENNDGYPITKSNYKITLKGKKLVENQFGKEDNEAFEKVIAKWGAKPLKEVIKHAKSLQ